MLVLVGVSLIVAKIHYSKVNSAVDPRIKNARELYKSYNILAIENRFLDVLDLLDKIENIYKSVPHYQNSYEVGVLYNNRTATYLTMALFKDSLKSPIDPFEGYSADSLVNLAERSALKSIEIYENWLSLYDSLNPEIITKMIKDTFLIGLDDYNSDQRDLFLSTRVKDIMDAQIENKRRLSVSYTNYGVIQRYHEDYKGAALSYTKAIDLWDRNLTAENNLNRLLGRPLKKRNIIQKLFPPDKD